MYDGIHLNDNVLSKVISFGYNEEYVKNCLAQNKHNHATTTYYLAMKNYTSTPDLLKEQELQAKLNRLIWKAAKAEESEKAEQDKKQRLKEANSVPSDSQKLLNVQVKRTGIVSALDDEP